VKLVDVRSREEFEAVKIEGSILLSQDVMRETHGERLEHQIRSSVIDHAGKTVWTRRRISWVTVYRTCAVCAAALTRWAAGSGYEVAEIQIGVNFLLRHLAKCWFRMQNFNLQMHCSGRGDKSSVFTRALAEKFLQFFRKPVKNPNHLMKKILLLAGTKRGCFCSRAATAQRWQPHGPFLKARKSTTPFTIRR